MEASTRQPYGYADDDPIDNVDPGGLSSLSDVGQFVAHNWRPIASVTVNVATVAGCAAPVVDAGCGIYIAGNAAAQSALVVTGPGSSSTKVGLVAANVVLAQGAGIELVGRGAASALQATNAAYRPARWVRPFLAGASATPSLGFDASQLAAYPWLFEC